MVGVSHAARAAKSASVSVSLMRSSRVNRSDPCGSKGAPNGGAKAGQGQPGEIISGTTNFPGCGKSCSTAPANYLIGEMGLASAARNPVRTALGGDGQGSRSATAAFMSGRVLEATVLFGGC